MPHQLWDIDAPKDTLKSIATASILDPLKYYCPNGAQEQFINTVALSYQDSKIPVVLFTAANGVGKTTITIHTLLNMVYGVRNGWFDQGIFKDFPYPKVIWYCSSVETIKNTVIPEFDRLVAEGSVEMLKDGKPHVSRMRFGSGWMVVFKTYDQDPSTYESANVGVIVADEPMPEPLWRAVKSRRRMGAVTLLPMTPLYTPPYILDEVKRAVDRGDKGYYHLKATVYDACRSRGKRGHLDSEIVDAMVKSYDPEERQARAFGEFTYFSGLIYPSINRDVHFVEPEDYPIPGYSRIFHVVDPHDSRMSACIWAALTPTGRYIIFSEYPNNTTQPYWDMKRPYSIEKEVEQWLEIEKVNPDWKVDNRIMDRTFGWQTRGQRTLSDIYLQEGKKHGVSLAFSPSYKGGRAEGEIQMGHKLVRKQLEPMKDGKPGLVIYNNCYHVWNGLTHYVRKHEQSKSSGDRGAGEGKIVEKYKDFPDVVRYLVCTAMRASIRKDKVHPSRKKWLDFKAGKKPNKYSTKTGWLTQ